MKLPLDIHFGQEFTWSHRLGNWHGVADASDLGFKCGQMPYKQVFDDACDVGFEVYSPRTGVTKLFTLVRENTNDWDLLSWDFISEDNNFTIRIYND
jgi:hypothetical protein